MAQREEGGPSESQPMSADSPAVFPEVLDVPQAAKFLQVTEATVREALAKGSLPGGKVGREWRLSKAALLEYLARPGTPRRLKRRGESGRQPEEEEA